MNTAQNKATWILKKYENRRLYDLELSRYVTLEEVAEGIRRGADPQIIDAKTGADLTQATLAQIIIEGRGASRLLPVPLLLRLIRMEDDVLADFLGRFLVGTLDLYQNAKQQLEAVAGMGPFGFGGQGFSPQDLFERFYRGVPFVAPVPPSTPGRAKASAPWTAAASSPLPSQPAPPPVERPSAPPEVGELASLRRELDALKDRLMGKRAKAKTKPRRKSS